MSESDKKTVVSEKGEKANDIENTNKDDGSKKDDSSKESKEKKDKDDDEKEDKVKMSALVKKTDEFVFNLFKEELPNSFIYHNYTHTKRVLKSANEILDNIKISEKDAEVVKLACLLHDVGYTKTREGHEEESVRIATEFLKSQDVNQETIDAVNKCIMATKFKDEPQSTLEKIVRDADSSHFAKGYFTEASEFLRKELEIQNVVSYEPDEWLDENIRVLSKSHQFYTDYALKNWQKTKDDNLADLIKTKKKTEKKLKKERMKAKYKIEAKDSSPDRGIQTFYRTALKNHIKLSDIADTKANILLSVNAIIISLVLSNIFIKLDNPVNDYLIWPTLIFTLGCIASIILSVIATRPNITRGEFTKEDVENKDVNLTFFGNFHKMKLEEYEWAIEEMLKDRDYVYSSMTKDLYFLGVVLDRKYRILRVTYNVFMVTIILSVIAYVVAFKIHDRVPLEELTSMVT